MSNVLGITEKVEEPCSHPEHPASVRPLGHYQTLRPIFLPDITQFPSDIIKGLFPGDSLPFTAPPVAGALCGVSTAGGTGAGPAAAAESGAAESSKWVYG